jgi:hypothetical protein
MEIMMMNIKFHLKKEEAGCGSNTKLMQGPCNEESLSRHQATRAWNFGNQPNHWT